MKNLSIKNGRIVDPINGVDSVGEIIVSSGRIVDVVLGMGDTDLSGVDKEALSVIDAEGCIVVPGLIDLHVHFRDPGQTQKEDIASGSGAAARGGFTGVCCMPNTTPPIDNSQVLDYVKEQGREVGLVDLMVAVAMTKGQEGKELADFDQLKAHGADAISEDGRTLMDLELMVEVAKRAKRLDLLIMDHTENHAITGGATARDIPRSAESDIVKRDVAIVREAGCRMHFQHISTRESVEVIRMAKAEGLTVTSETAPHFIALTEAGLDVHGADAKMNPPLRTEGDRLAIIEGLVDGTIDAIATDHAPHTCDEKSQPIDRAPFGIIGLDTSFAVCHEILVKGDYMDISMLIEKMAASPAKIMRKERGSIGIGDVADIAIIEMASAKIDKTQFHSKAKNTPFDGMEVSSSIKTTIKDGRITYDRRKDNV